jgi:hypothetical protein
VEVSVGAGQSSDAGGKDIEETGCRIVAIFNERYADEQ